MSSAFDTRVILVNLLKVYNQSGYESLVSELIKRWLNKHNIKFYTDKVGNIYNFDIVGAPFLNAHLDSVQTSSDIWAGKKLTVDDNLIIKSKGHIIGGDDLCGVYIILYLLGYTQLKFNWILTVSEESGGQGASDFCKTNFKFLTESPFGLVLDRRSNGDIICTENNYGTQEFENALAKVGKDFGYKVTSGVWCDANFWKEHVSVANLSCGYYEPHSRNEYVNLNDVFNTIEYVKAILSSVKEKFEKPKEYIYTRKYGFHNLYGYDDYIKDYKKYYGYDYRDDSRRSTDCFNEKEKTKVIEEDEFIEEEDEIKKCIICGAQEFYAHDYSLVKIDVLKGYLCETCLYDLYGEVTEKIDEFTY